MRIQFVAPTSNYTQLPNAMIRCRELSYRAVGLYAYVRSLPPGASTTLETLARLKSEGKDAVHKARRELEDAGFLRVVEERHRGQYAGCVWMLADKPHEFEELLPGADGEVVDKPAPARLSKPGPEACDPTPDLPLPEKPSTANPPHYKTDEDNNTDVHKTDGSGAGDRAGDVQTLVEAWNQFADAYAADGVPRVERLTSGKRLQAAKARLKDPYWRERYTEALQQIPHQRWRMGVNDREWVANLEWFVRPDTVDKLIEERRALGDRLSTGQRHGDLSSVRPGAFD